MVPAEALADLIRTLLMAAATARTQARPPKRRFTAADREATAAEAEAVPGIDTTDTKRIIIIPAKAAKDHKAAKAPTALSSFMFRRKTWLNIKVH